MDDNTPLFNNPELIEKFIKANTQFALDLFKNSCIHHGNVLLSPLSVSAVLSMILAGAKGETATEISDVLHLDFLGDEEGENETLDNLNHLAFQDLKTSLTASSEDETSNVRWAHRLYVQEDYTFNQDLSSQLEQHYGFGMIGVNFARAVDEATDQINAWVGDQMGEQLWQKGLIGEGILDIFNVLVGVAVSSFQGQWATPFQEGHLSPFQVGSGRKIFADQMRTVNSEEFRYARNDDLACQLLELPYTGNRFALMLIVPDDVEEFHKLEETLNVDILDGLIGQLEPVTMRLSLPKFQVSCIFSISDVIGTLGAKLLLDPDNADLTGLVDNEQESKLYLSALIHGAQFRVTEKGTELSDQVPPSDDDTDTEETQVTVDRPFIFFLRDVVSGLIIFIGCVHEPSTKEIIF